MDTTANRLASRPASSGVDTLADDEGSSPWVVDIASGRVVRRTGAAVLKEPAPTTSTLHN